MSKATLDTIVYIAVPVIVTLVIFKDYIHIGRYHFGVPEETYDYMVARAKARNMSILAFTRKVLKNALTLEAIDADPTTKIIIKKEGEEQKELKW